MDFDDKTSIVDGAALAALTGKTQARSACFIVLAGEQTGRMHKLDQSDVVIGRSLHAGIRIVDEGVSRRHARILRQEDGNVLLKDLGSTNGTYCNGERIQTRVLQDGDRIQIGTTTILKFSYQDSLEESFQRRQYEFATRDALTGCFNRKYLLDRLPAEMAFARRHGQLLSLAMMDIDHFKRVNDTYGHQAGDHVLHHIANVMQQTVRSDDILARYGGEEFALIMRETPADRAFIAVERIRRKVEATTIIHEDQPLVVTVSIGVATFGDGQPDLAEALIQEADEYLYKAKRNGRNRTESEAIG